MAAVGETEDADPAGLGGVDGRREATSAMPSRIGRFVVLSALGAGGMGIVYGAYDPDLDRRVAIKLWSHEPGRSRGASDALLAEARAMARVTHPNVVVVHEVGLFEGRMFLAMEYVRGETLRQWLARERRDWRTIVHAFLEAGRGLAAVHEAGLVHRDFKPDNVMVREDGRVQVMDFGIAGETTTGGSRFSPTREPLHAGGAPRLVGTPAYMAPEQFRGLDLDARADQFSFSVALFTALTGVVPFGGSNVVRLFEAVDAGVVAAVPRGVDVPARVLEVLRRGLRNEPSDRWPDMQTLLARLDALARPRWWRRWVAAGVLASAGTIAFAASRGPACDDGTEAMAGTWSPAIARDIGDAFARAAPGYGAGAWSALVPEIDRVVDGWLDARKQACTVESAPLRGLQQLCLDDQRMVLETLLDELGSPDEATVRNAAQAVAGLDAATTCADPEALRRRLPPPSDPAVRAEVDAVERELARVDQFLELGRYAEGVAAAHDAVAHARTAGFAPTHARALLLRGQHERYAGDVDRAAASLREAYAEARRAGAYATAATSARELGATLGVIERRFDLARTWLDVAATEAELAGSPAITRELEGTRAALLYAEGRYVEATNGFEAVLAASEAAGVRATELAAIKHSLATSLAGVGRHHDALAHLESNLTLAMSTGGPSHPSVGDAWMGIGHTLGALHRSAEAVEAFRHALENREVALGPRHHEVANTLSSMAAEQMELGALDEARVTCERALEIFDQSLGEMHPDTAGCLNTLALVHWDRDWAATRGYLSRGVAVARASLGDHPTVAALLNNLAAAEEKLGEITSAHAHYEEAIAMREAIVGDDDPGLAYPLKNLGALLQRTGRTSEARRMLRRAIALFEAAEGSDAGDHGAAVWSLALAYGDPPADPIAAHGLATEALALLERDTQSPLVSTIAMVRAWLAAHPRATTTQTRPAP
jgi:serine/threonine-protein kinase